MYNDEESDDRRKRCSDALKRRPELTPTPSRFGLTSRPARCPSRRWRPASRYGVTLGSIIARLVSPHFRRTTGSIRSHQVAFESRRSNLCSGILVLVVAIGLVLVGIESPARRRSAALVARNGKEDSPALSRR
jgi:hypothetical protein